MSKNPVRPNQTELSDAQKVALAETVFLRFYMVVNDGGLFFRAKGYGGYGTTWVEEVNRGRVYNKIGPARACVTFFSKDASYNPPKIIEIGPDGSRYVQ